MLVLSPLRDGGYDLPSQKGLPGTSLVGQWLRLHAPSAGAPGSIPGQGTKSCMLQLRPGTAKKKKEEGPSSSPGTPFPTLSPPPSGDRTGGVLEEMEHFCSRVLEPVTWGLWVCQLLPEG